MFRSSPSEVLSWNRCSEKCAAKPQENTHPGVWSSVHLRSMLHEFLKFIEDTSTFFASLGPISEKYLLKFSAIRSALVTSLLFIISFFGKFSWPYFFFPMHSLIVSHVSLILFLYFRINFKKCSFLECFWMLQKDVYNFYIRVHFFHFSFLKIFVQTLLTLWRSSYSFSYPRTLQIFVFQFYLFLGKYVSYRV